MAFNDLERKRIQKLVGAFIEQIRPPGHIRPQLDFGFHVAGHSIELFEIRPQWDKPKVKHEHSFAKATYVRTRDQWKIYWKRADLKWHGYEPAPHVRTVADFLSVVKEDQYGCFYG